MANLAINTETQRTPENINNPETLETIETPDNENPQINMNTATNVYLHLPHISLRDTVPCFNGRNIPLHQFIKRLSTRTTHGKANRRVWISSNSLKICFTDKPHG